MSNKKSIVDSLREYLENKTPEELNEIKEKYFPEDETPKGWVDIEEHLPMCKAVDYVNQGYSIYLVKDSCGDEYESYVTDHNTWYYQAKEQGITHWYNK